MPLYEFECERCSHRFERIQRFSDPHPDGCPVCGGAVRKLLASPAIQFKGSGWYITDYARAGKPEGAGAEARGEGKGESGSGTPESGGDRKTPGTSEGPSAAKPDAKSQSGGAGSSSSSAT